MPHKLWLRYKVRHCETDLGSYLHIAVKHTPSPPMWSNVCVGVQPEQNKPVSKCRQTFPVFSLSHTYCQVLFSLCSDSDSCRWVYYLSVCFLKNTISCILKLNLLIRLNNPKELKWVMDLICVLFLLCLKCGFGTPCSGFMWLHSVISAWLLRHRLALLGVA